MATIYHARKDSAVYDKEKMFLAFLYDEGPHTIDQISETLLMTRDYTAKMMTSLHEQGLVDKERLMSGGKGAYYWIIRDGAEHF